MSAILTVKNLDKSFVVKQKSLGDPPKRVYAVRNVSLSLKKGEILGIVGESGCGKSTLARLIIGLIEPDSGEIYYNGVNFTEKNEGGISGARSRNNMRKNIQMVFQNPYSSLNPKMTIVENVEFGLTGTHLSKRERKQKTMEILQSVGIPEYLANRYPASLSGGQRQRIAIARALINSPKIVIADEPVSALDKSIQAQVLNLIRDLSEKLDISVIFISHDLKVIEYMSDNIMVMYLGTCVELGKADDICDDPLHPYTRELLNSAPGKEKRSQQSLEDAGEFIDLPSPMNLPSGCKFHPRCKDCLEICKVAEPKMIKLSNGRFIACHKYNRT